jgi:N-acetylmuramic acid 6-phosphate etherase
MLKDRVIFEVQILILIHMTKESKLKAESFLEISSQYKLGSLLTESSHPDTRNLSYLAVNDLSRAISVLKELDKNTLTVLHTKVNAICALKEAISDTFRSGNDVYFCGCGATGRLSLTIETLWRQVHKNKTMENRVFSFMSGGDVALIRSIENFEDYTQYGARQLVETGFKDGDLLVGITEGGETPIVIGAVEEAVRLSKRKPCFLYCNPDDILCKVAERSKKVIENPGIVKINLTVGPMGITGSTRMQSSTVLLAGAGLALFYYDRKETDLEITTNNLLDYWNSTDISFIGKYIESESAIYKNGDYLLYESDPYLGITIITDTTERSPTFSLYPFENLTEKDPKISLCYLYMPSAENSETAWEKLLWRKPRTLEWPEIDGIASLERLLGFDFSSKVFERRKKESQPGTQHIFRIDKTKDGIEFILEKHKHMLHTSFADPICDHLVLKMILNIHSTLIMGRLGRYEGNVMTYVKASNNKLIDRSIRYIDLILKNYSITVSYDEICHALYDVLEVMPPDQSVVLTTVDEIRRRTKK